MAKLVIGNNKTVGVPVITKEIQVAPNYWISRKVENGTYKVGDQTEFSFGGATDVSFHALEYAFYNSGSLSSVDGFENIKTVGTNGLSNAFGYSAVSVSGSDFGSLESIENYGMMAAFYRCQNVSGIVDLSKLTSVSSFGMQDCFAYTKIVGLNVSSLTYCDQSSFSECCQYCLDLTSFDFSSLVEIRASGLSRCFYSTGLSVASFPKLKKIGQSGLQQCFQGCSGLTSISMPCLEELEGTVSTSSNMSSAFMDSGVTSAVFPRLKIMKGGQMLSSCFQGCPITSLSFPSLRMDSFGTRNNQFSNMLYGVTGCTVHFPSNIQSTIGSWSSVTGGFGGTNITVLFDLPATVTLTGANGVDYQRDPNYDTAGALAWYNETDGYEVPFYTSGTSDPTTGATIYSDSSCTTAVTTISSIA